MVVLDVMWNIEIQCSCSVKYKKLENRVKIVIPMGWIIK
jgi:hypothetical protein